VSTPQLLKIYARFINSFDDYQTQTAQRRSWLWNNHEKNVPWELLANGTTMTRAEMMRRALSFELNKSVRGPSRGVD
jgi:hypothetical protein